MITLLQEFKIKGQRNFLYRQLKREGDVVVAQQVDNEKGSECFGQVIAHEIFVVQKYPDRMSPDNKTFIPAKEAPPRSELWGVLGFTCTSEERAMVRFSELVNTRQLKN